VRDLDYDVYQLLLEQLTAEATEMT